MRDPFGFISYRIGPPPSVIITTVWWSLAIVLAVTVGVQAGSTGIALLKEKYGKEPVEDSASQATGVYEHQEAVSEDAGGRSTFEATPYNADGTESDGSGQGLPPMPNTDKPVPAAL